MYDREKWKVSYSLNIMVLNARTVRRSIKFKDLYAREKWKVTHPVNIMMLNSMIVRGSFNSKDTLQN